MTTDFPRRFHASGFGVIKHAISADAASDLETRLVKLLPTSGSPLQRVIPRVVELDEQFAEIATSRPLASILNSIFGVTPHLVCTYGHEKPAGTRAHTGPHSDVAHLTGVPHHQSMLMVKVMLALTPVAAGAGGTFIVPGSHIADDNGAEGVHVCLEPGDLILFHANIRHTATANTSMLARLSLWFTYAQPWMRAFPGCEFSEAFVGRLRHRFASEPHLPALLGLTDPYATA